MPKKKIPECVDAADFLKAGLTHMENRADTYDKEGERSMGKTVEMFNTLHGTDLTEEQGWSFMILLKQVRASQGVFNSDNYEDSAAYSGLQGEAAKRDR